MKRGSVAFPGVRFETTASDLAAKSPRAEVRRSNRGGSFAYALLQKRSIRMWRLSLAGTSHHISSISARGNGETLLLSRFKITAAVSSIPTSHHHRNGKSYPELGQHDQTPDSHFHSARSTWPSPPPASGRASSWFSEHHHQVGRPSPPPKLVCGPSKVGPLAEFSNVSQQQATKCSASANK